MGRSTMHRARWLAIIAAALALLPAAAAAQVRPVDRTRLDQLIATLDAADPESNPASYRAMADAALAEAQRLYPPDHPEIAARRVGVAGAVAANGKMDEALATLDAVTPVLAGAMSAPRYRTAWRNALSLRAYILNYKADHDGAMALNEQLIADYAGDPTAGPSKDRAAVLSNLAASYLEHGRLEDALTRNAQAIDMGLALDPVPNDVAVWYANRVAYLYSAGRTEDAIATSQAALARLTPKLGADHPLMANLYANLGAILYRINRPHDAMPMIRHAYETIEKAAGGPTQTSATMRVQFAQALIRTHHYADALTFLDAATPIIDAQLGAESDRALGARDTRLVALIETGQGGPARQLAQQLLEIRDRKSPEGHRDRANARDNLAKAAFAGGDWATAERAAGEAVALRTRMLPADHPDLLLARIMLLRVQDRAGTRPAAQLLAEARALFKALTLNANLARGSAQAERQRAGYGWLAELFARRGDAEDAFAAQQWASRSSLDEALAVAASERAAAADPAFAALVGERRKLLAARQGVEARLDANLAKPDPAFDLIGVTAQLAANKAAIAALDARMTAVQRAQFAFTPSRLAEVVAASRDGTTTAMITDLGGPWLVTAVTGTRVRQHLVAAEAGVPALVGRVRAALARGSAAPFDRAAAASLYRSLFAPDIAAAIGASRRLAVVADGALGALPFGVLVSDSGSRAYLIDHLVVARLVRAPQATQAARAPHGGDMLIAFGGVEGRRAGALMAMRSPGTARSIDALPELPDARRELTALAQAMGTHASQLLIGEQATEAQLRALSVPTGAILSFATHGLVSGELDGLDQPALLLTPAGSDDGLLKPSEIGAMHLPARLVILSACNTASGAGDDRPQLTGLVQGFFLAGADRVMASHWPVRDDIARRLSVGTVKAMRGGADSASALRSAILAIRAGSDGEAGASHPALWAPFELFSR